ncbi:hypothetical protein VPNG_03975 [Cytospora leucostoma]|uniref:Uncharacterized protein n=1 Tax=Cytospora leucostoma TaxID=1230097 RepID=A0A423XE65_9PEZI|nr:hypothetical protein VPNG_03975 [Cytospora leucostoma]
MKKNHGLRVDRCAADYYWTSESEQKFVLDITGHCYLNAGLDSSKRAYRMTSHSNAGQESPTTSSTTSIPTIDSNSDMEEDANNEMTEEEIERWYARAYDRGSAKPMKEPLTAPWGLPISDADVEKLKVGFRSRDMEDRWDILIEDPDEKGNVSIHILRSWLQEDCYILHIVPKPSNEDGGTAKIESITWEGNKGGLQCNTEQAKKEAVILSRNLLHAEFEKLPHYPSSEFYDRRGYKKLNAE